MCWCVGLLVCWVSSSFLSSTLLQVLVATAPALLGEIVKLGGVGSPDEDARIAVIHLLFHVLVCGF